MVGRRHLGVLAGMSDVEVVAVADASPEAAAAAAAELGCAPYGDGLAMLEREDLDAVWLCVPPFAHGALELAAVERGLPFFVEKPISLDRETALEIADAVRQRPLVTAVGYQWRHLDTVRRASDLLASAPAHLALAEWSSKTPRAPWWRTEALSGGQVLEQGTHLFDVVRHLVGEPTRVFGTCARAPRRDLPDADVPTATAVTLEVEGGRIAVVTTTCLLSRPHRIEVRLFGEGLVVELTETDMTVDQDGESWRAEAAVNPFAEEDRQFLDAVRAGGAGAGAGDGTGDGVAVPYDEALRTHLVVLAAVEAMRTGRSVDVAASGHG